ncbi:MAG: hypothetical protein KAS32_01265 [Candidatus Peribacteraceae bacterium]|nr:hypothetical protein [Candidatus Peribacteraceae bacterium]
MIHSVTLFLPNTKNDNVHLHTVLENEDDWPVRMELAELQLYIKEEIFIKLKNEILSLDRQIDERRKNARISKRS